MELQEKLHRVSGINDADQILSQSIEDIESTISNLQK